MKSSFSHTLQGVILVSCVMLLTSVFFQHAIVFQGEQGEEEEHAHTMIQTSSNPIIVPDMHKQDLNPPTKHTGIKQGSIRSLPKEEKVEAWTNSRDTEKNSDPTSTGMEIKKSSNDEKPPVVTEKGVVESDRNNRQESSAQLTEVQKQKENRKHSIPIVPTSTASDEQNITKSLYNKEEYTNQLEMITKPFANETTGAQFYKQGFWGGFVNQLQKFVGLMILAHEQNHKQILLPSIRWRDQHGSLAHLRHELLFDVVHWNSFYPILPRFVTHDPVLHSDVGIEIMSRQYYWKPKILWKETKEAIENATNVFPLGLFDAQYSNKYGQYTRDITERGYPRDEWEIVMTATALRPHPEVQQLVDNYLDTFSKQIERAKNQESGSSDYMLLHARVEPDMQVHTPCQDKKVTNFTDILTSIQDHFSEPPANNLILALDRGLLEKGVDDPKNTNELQKYNLKVLNEVVTNGLWGGRVKVLEAGRTFMEKSGHPYYGRFPSLMGSIVDFFLAQNSKVFIGTEVSSWSNAVTRFRFYNNKKQNYVYRPGNVIQDTLDDLKAPHPFLC